ncbi:MAG: M48 family metallopeptidase [Deltaproteobacteria bacterium]|nr:M48 family metallopeptidase [Deltaproteobacteria bacterium]
MILLGNTRLRLWLILVTALVMAFFASCAEVPLTGRKSLRLVPEHEVLSLSFQQYNEVLKKSTLSKDKEKVEMVRQVGRRIARAAEEFLEDQGLGYEIEHYQWEFNLIENDKVVNAWCMPGGKVAIYTGILKYTKDEAGLAVVLGHEVAHAIAHHGNERMSEALLANFGGMALSVALANRPTRTRQLFMAAFGVGANVGFLLPYSRIQESEADHIGVVLMARAGYDPRAALSFWKRMRKTSSKRPPEFLSTHPAPETRIKRLMGYVDEAMQYYRG